MTPQVTTWRTALAIETLRGLRDALVIYPLMVGALYAFQAFWAWAVQTPLPLSLQPQHLFADAAMFSLPVVLLRARPSRNIIARLLVLLGAVVVFAAWRICVEPGLWPIALGGLVVVALIAYGLIWRWKQEFDLKASAGRFDPPLMG